MSIQVKDLSFSYGKRNILQNISLQVPDKQFVGVIGPNGSGKSTLLKCLYRVLKPTSGDILLDGNSIQKLSIKQTAQQLAVVAQHNQYQFDFYVEEVVLMGRSPHKKTMDTDNAEDYAIAKWALEQVGMYHFKERSFATLSGGEQQRVVLARALAQKTPHLVLDEPTNHLDIQHQLQLLSIAKNLDLTIVSAIHDLNIASMFCDYIYVLKDGQLCYEGVPEVVLTKEMIRDIYQVDSEIVLDTQGKRHILFTGQ